MQECNEKNTKHMYDQPRMELGGQLAEKMAKLAAMEGGQWSREGGCDPRQKGLMQGVLAALGDYGARETCGDGCDVEGVGRWWRLIIEVCV